MGPVKDASCGFSGNASLCGLGDEFEGTFRVGAGGAPLFLFFGGPPQIRAGLNMTYPALLSTVYCAVKAIVDPTIPPNAGLARPLHVTAPEGTVVNCVHPAAVNGRLSLCQRVVDLIFGALGQAVP